MITATTDAELTATMIGFIQQVGIPVKEASITKACFLPGLRIEEGCIIIDPAQMMYPGDLLHEAGHIAVVPATDRPQLDNENIPLRQQRDAEEMMAICWSYAACYHLGIDPTIVFHDNGYKGDGEWIIETFSGGNYFGVPVLQWAGLTHAPNSGQPGAYPAMIKWLRD